MKKTVKGVMFLSMIIMITDTHAANLRAKAMADAYTAAMGDANAWSYNPASVKSRHRNKSSEFYIDYSQVVERDDGTLASKVTSVGLLAEWEQTALGMEYNYLGFAPLLPMNACQSSTGCSEKELVSGQELLFGLSHRTESEWGLGVTASVVYADKDTEYQAQEDLGYSLGITKSWSGYLKPTSHLTNGWQLTLGGSYQSDKQLEFTNTGESITVAPQQWSLGAQLSVGLYHRLIHQMVDFNIDIEQTSELTMLPHMGNMQLLQFGVQWRGFRQQQNTPSRWQLSFRGGMQWANHEQLEPILSFGSTVSYRNHSLDFAYWERFIDKRITRHAPCSSLGLGYSYQF